MKSFDADIIDKEQLQNAFGHKCSSTRFENNENASKSSDRSNEQIHEFVKAEVKVLVEKLAEKLVEPYMAEV